MADAPEPPDELGAVRGDPATPRRWRLRAVSSLLFAAVALLAGGVGLFQLLATGRVDVVPNRPDLAGHDAVEAVAVYLALGGALLLWGLYARRRSRGG